MIATTKEQSHRLLACGVSANTADMYYLVETLKIGPVSSDIWKNKPKEITHAWSLSRLLELMPKEIYDDYGDSYYFSLAKEFPFSEVYGASYISCWDYDNDNIIILKKDISSIEACIQLIEWLISKNYKLNKII